jgi:hypothetical protein
MASSPPAADPEVSLGSKVARRRQSVCRGPFVTSVTLWACEGTFTKRDREALPLSLRTRRQRDRSDKSPPFRAHAYGEACDRSDKSPAVHGRTSYRGLAGRPPVACRDVSDPGAVHSEGRVLDAPRAALVHVGDQERDLQKSTPKISDTNDENQSSGGCPPRSLVAGSARRRQKEEGNYGRRGARRWQAGRKSQTPTTVGAPVPLMGTIGKRLLVVPLGPGGLIPTTDVGCQSSSQPPRR